MSGLFDLLRKPLWKKRFSLAEASEELPGTLRVKRACKLHKKTNAYANLPGTFRVKRSCGPQKKKMLTPTFREPSESSALPPLQGHPPATPLLSNLSPTGRLRDAYGLLT